MIKTERLELVPLSPECLRLWIEDLPRLERELACSYQAEPLEGFFRGIVEGQLAVTRRDPEHYKWHSFWLLIRTADRVVVGSADFKNAPDQNGTVEIGYGLGKRFEHNGYMTEAVGAMCGWALQQSGVTSVLAETEQDGYASQRILERCGFVKERQDKTLWWRLEPARQRPRV